MTSDGTPWRPLVHVLDICQAILCALRAPRDGVHNQILNVGNNAQNYRVRQVAEIVAEVFPGCELRLGESGSDHRSYRVSFDRIREILSEFDCAWPARRGAEQLRAVFEAIAMDREIFNYRGFTRLKQLKHLLRTHQIDSNFYWVGNAAPAAPAAG